MYPVFEQASGRGVGHGLESFVERFDAICNERATKGRAKAFAFIFYDFRDDATKRILKDQGVFAQLDRLSRSVLSIFYLHGGSQESIQRFNDKFIGALNLKAVVKPPCVVFFKLGANGAEEVSAVQLENQSLIHGFKELHDVINSYIAGSAVEKVEGSRSLEWVRGATKFVSLEALRAALKAALAAIFS